MPRKLVVIVFILISITTFAQREVFFNSSKPEDLKVQSLKGLELQIDYNPLSIFNSSIYFNSIPYYAGFFSEKRIAPTMTLGYSVGLVGSTYKVPVIIYDSISNGYSSGFSDSSNSLQVFSLGLKVGIEPRWYWNFKKRAENNKARLNSGWFLSLPLNYEYIMYSSYKPPYPPYYSFKSFGNLTLKPTIGYRQSITKNIFLEGSFGYGIGLGLSTLSNHFLPYFSDTEPELKIKAAYTFK